MTSALSSLETEICMAQSKTILTGVFTLSITLTASYVQAGWGDILKEVEKQAPSVMESLSGSSTSAALPNNLSTEELIAGLKQALEIGTKRAVDTVSATDGYLGNPDIKIPLPNNLQAAAELLDNFGMSSLVEQFETSMNRAAEAAAPEAQAVFLDTLSEMTIEDAKEIYQGSDDAATQYFDDKTRDQLTQLFKPLVADSMTSAGVTKYYQQLVAEAQKYPLVSSLNLDLESYVTDQALDGLFVMLAAEEKAIREDPAARSTELLKKLFSN